MSKVADLTVYVAIGAEVITGSTRMQATTIQLCVLLTVMEMVLRELIKELDPNRCAGLRG